MIVCVEELVLRRGAQHFRLTVLRGQNRRSQNAELEKECEKLSELVAQLEEMFRLVRSESLTQGKIAPC